MIFLESIYSNLKNKQNKAIITKSSDNPPPPKLYANKYIVGEIWFSSNEQLADRSLCCLPLDSLDFFGVNVLQGCLFEAAELLSTLHWCSSDVSPPFQFAPLNLARTCCVLLCSALYVLASAFQNQLLHHLAFINITSTAWLFNLQHPCQLSGGFLPLPSFLSPPPISFLLGNGYLFALQGSWKIK